MESELMKTYQYFKKKADEYEEYLRKKGELPTDMIPRRDQYEKRLADEIYQVDALDVESLKEALWDRIEIMQERYNEDISPVWAVVESIIDRWLEDKEI